MRGRGVDRLILTRATRIYGTGAEPVREHALVLEEARIKAVIPIGRHPTDAAVLDLEGLTLLPGLINCHVHLCLGGEADPARVLLEDPPALRAIKAGPPPKPPGGAGGPTAR